MEVTCTRCHQAVQADNCYCPACGLPQLVYSAEAIPGQASPEKWTEAIRDASTIDWKAALRAALMLAVPAGLLSSMISPIGFGGVFWMAAAAAGAVMIYMRGQRPAWITLGAGARIGLVTGLLGGWMAFAISGGALFVQRFVLHQPTQIDGLYKTLFLDTFSERAQQSMAGMAPTDAAQVQIQLSQIEAWMRSPEGHAGIWAFGFAFNSAFLLFFGMVGGLVGARMLAGSRRPEV